MAAGQLSKAIQDLRRAMLPGGDGMSDEQLLDHFIERRPSRHAAQPEVARYRGEVMLFYPKLLPKPEDELFTVAVGIEEAGNAVLDELPARTQIGGDDGPSPGIGFQNGFTQGLVGVGRKHGEAAAGDQFLEFFAMDHALEQYIVQV